MSRSRSKSSSRERKSRSRTKSRSSPRNRSSSSGHRETKGSRSKSRAKSYSRSPSRDRNRSHSRSPQSRRRRHIGDRDEPPENKCLGVFGLSLYTTESDIRRLFEKYGSVNSCMLVSDHASGRSRGFGFVNMNHLSDAKYAKEKLNGAKVDDRYIRVDFSVTKRPHSPTPGKYMGRHDQRSGFRSRDSNRRRSRSRESHRGSYRRSRSRSPYRRR